MNSRLFDNKLTALFLLFLIPLLFLPKINLVSVANETAGLRMDDLFLFLFGVSVLTAHYLLHRKLNRLEAWIALFTGLAFLSFLTNRLLVSQGSLPLNAKIFYVFRLMEYFLFFYVGVMAARAGLGRKVIIAFLVWNVLIMTLQKFGILGGLSVSGYHSDISQRVQGVASFPSEMGLILNLLFAYFLFQDKDKTSRSEFFPYFLFALFGLYTILTANRISLAALVVCFLGYLVINFRIRSMGSMVAIGLLLPIIFAVSWFLIMHSEALFQRSAGLMSFKNVELAGLVWDRIDLSQDPLENDVTASEDYDLSWWIRIHKWLYALKVYVSHPECYLQGIGPGCAWSALDGGILRVFIENGIIGFIVFSAGFVLMMRINQRMKWMMVAFAMNMIFFDAYLAYKTMSLLFFIAGEQKSLSLKSAMD